MSRLLSDRAEKTSQVVVLPASLEDPSKTAPGLYRIGLIAVCLSIFAFFFALVFAYYWRSSRPPYWDPITLPKTLWISTALILTSSVTFEAARRVFARDCGVWHRGFWWSPRAWARGSSRRKSPRGGNWSTRARISRRIRIARFFIYSRDCTPRTWWAGWLRCSLSCWQNRRNAN